MGKITRGLRTNSQSTSLRARYIDGIPSAKANESNNLYLNTKNPNGKVYIKVNGENKSMQDFFASASEVRNKLSDILAGKKIIMGSDATSSQMIDRIQSDVINASVSNGTILPISTSGGFSDYALGKVKLFTRVDNEIYNSSTEGVSFDRPSSLPGGYSPSSTNYIFPLNDDVDGVLHVIVYTNNSNSTIKLVVRKRTIIPSSTSTGYGYREYPDATIRRDGISISGSVENMTFVYNEAMDRVFCITVAGDSDKRTVISEINYHTGAVSETVIRPFQHSPSNIRSKYKINMESYSIHYTKLLFYSNYENNKIAIALYDLKTKKWQYIFKDISVLIERDSKVGTSNFTLGGIGYDIKTKLLFVIGETHSSPYKLFVWGTDLYGNMGRNFSEILNSSTSSGKHGVSGIRVFSLHDGTFLVFNNYNSYYDRKFDGSVLRVGLPNRKDFPKFRIGNGFIRNGNNIAYHTDIRVPHTRDFLESTRISVGGITTMDVFYKFMPLIPSYGYLPIILPTEYSYNSSYARGYAFNKDAYRPLFDMFYTGFYNYIITDSIHNIDGYCDILAVTNSRMINAVGRDSNTHNTHLISDVPSSDSLSTVGFYVDTKLFEWGSTILPNYRGGVSRRNYTLYYVIQTNSITSRLSYPFICVIPEEKKFTRHTSDEMHSVVPGFPIESARPLQ